MKLSLVIPAYNESEIVLETIRTVTARLAELISEGQQFTSFQYPGTLREGDQGENVRALQYMLSMVSQFYNTVPPVTIDGSFGPSTTRAVRAVWRIRGSML